MGLSGILQNSYVDYDVLCIVHVVGLVNILHELIIKNRCVSFYYMQYESRFYCMNHYVNHYVLSERQKPFLGTLN